MATIRELRDDDLAGIHRVALDAGLSVPAGFEDWRRHFLWASADSRDSFAEANCPLGFVAVQDDAIVGYTSLGYRRIVANGVTETAAVQNSLAVSPQAQGMLGLLLCREPAQRIRQGWSDMRVLGLHHARAVGMIWSRLGARGLAGSDLTCRLLVSPGRLLANRFGLPSAVAGVMELPGLRQAAVAMLQRKGFGAAVGRAGLPAGLVLDEADNAAGALSDPTFLDRCQDAAAFGVKRDGDYLNWRYARHPVGGHRFIVISRGGTQVGLIVLGPVKQASTRLFEVLFVRDGTLDPGGMAALCASAAALCGAGVLVTKVTEPALVDAWRAEGGVIEHKGYDQFWYTGAEAGADSIRFTFGDFSED